MITKTVTIENLPDCEFKQLIEPLFVSVFCQLPIVAVYYDKWYFMAGLPLHIFLNDEYLYINNKATRDLLEQYLFNNVHTHKGCAVKGEILPKNVGLKLFPELKG